MLQSFHRESTHRCSFSAGQRWCQLRIMLSGRDHQRRQAQGLLLQAGDVTLHLAEACGRACGWLDDWSVDWEDEFSRIRGFLSLSLTESHWISLNSQWNSMEFHGIPSQKMDHSSPPSAWSVLPGARVSTSQPAGSYSNAQPAINGYHHWSYWHFFPHFAWKTDRFLHQWSHNLLAVSSYIEASNVSGVTLQ